MRRWALVATLGVIALLVVLLVLRPGTPAATLPDEGGGGVVVPVEQITATLTLRGRTLSVATPAPVAVATTPPDTSPTPEPTIVVRPVAPGPIRTGAPGGSGSGGTGIGSGSGSGAGSGSGSGSATPPPAPTPPGALNPTYGRFSILVLDGVSGAPVSNVCLLIGTGDCSATKPHTDASGRWTTDVPLGTPTLVWDVFFMRAGYAKYYQQFTLVQGQTVTYVVRLQPATS